MRVVEIRGSRHAAVVEAPTPEPGPGEVLVEVAASGVCASDVALWETPGDVPVRHGHEFSGVVAALGDAVTTLAVGDRVTGFGSPSHATHLVAAQDDVLPLPDRVPLWAGLGEPLACVVGAVRRARIAPGEPVAVVGLGSMGAIAAQVAVALGAGSVELHDRDAGRVARVAALVGDRVDRRGSARPRCAVVLEFTGSAGGLELAGRLTRPMGRLVVGGYHATGERRLDLDWWYRGIDVLGGFTPDRPASREAMALGLELAARGDVDLEALVTHRLGLGAVDEAYALLRERPPGFVKAVLEP
ncbi:MULTISPECIES: alcohol dehydrogenase catalytic domain-containing protein [unclassified Isoptericola]|uniref:alcohol dehydrogenase catalytic domain-containing protein n=1 Tax=unclassified Isoptericola TaxID=2623355 RepID=UPI0036630C06